MTLIRVQDGNSLSRRSLVSQHVSRSDQRISRRTKVVVVRRDNREKIVVSLDEIAVKLREILEQEQRGYVQQSRRIPEQPH